MKKIFMLCILLFYTSPSLAQKLGNGTWVSGDWANGNYVSFDEQGRYIDVGDSSVMRDDIRVSANSTFINPLTSKPDYVTFISNTKTFHFDAGADETVTFAIQLPHSYKEGTDLEVHIHWSPTSTNTGNVAWLFEYTAIAIDGTFSAVDTTSAIQAGSGTAYAHQVAEFAAVISGIGLTISSMIMCALTRDVDYDDDYSGEAAFLEFDLHYQMDSLGSRWEDLK